MQSKSYDIEAEVIFKEINDTIFDPWNCRFVINHEFIGDDKSMFVPVKSGKERKRL